MLNILIRVDASLQLGSGHVMRCLTLARALIKRGHSVSFICKALEGNMVATIKSEGISCFVLPSTQVVAELSKLGSQGRGHSLQRSNDSDGQALEVAEIEDAQQCLQAVSACRFDWVIVDHYALGVEWAAIIRSTVPRQLVIDDLADREHDADVLLDQNITFDYLSRYNNKVPSRCLSLLGPDYALLGPEYCEARERTHNRSLDYSRIVIFFGGMDAANMTSRTIEGLSALKVRVPVDVVTGGHNPHNKQIKGLVDDQPNMTWHCAVPSLQPLLERADVCIGAGGVNTLERLCLKLPTIAVCVADNQESAINYLSSLNVQVRLARDFSAAELAKAFSQIRRIDRDYLSGLVDGLGCSRVVDVIESCV